MHLALHTHVIPHHLVIVKSLLKVLLTRIGMLRSWIESFQASLTLPQLEESYVRPVL